MTTSEHALERYRLLAEHARDIVLFVRPRDGRVVEANDAALAAYGYTRDELLGLTVFELRDPAGSALVPVQMLGADATGLTFETSHRRKDGSTFPVEVSSRGAVVGGERLLLSLVRDVSERKAAEEALRASEERFRALMEQAPFSVQVLAPEGHTLRVNRAFEELWGVTLDQLADYNMLRDPQLEAKGVAPYIRRAFAGEAVRIPAVAYDPNETIPGRTRHPDPVRWVAAVAYPLKDAAGRVREVVLIHEDATARRRAEEARRGVEERFARFMQHLPGLAWIKDLQGRYVYANDAAVHAFGARREDLYGRTDDEVFPPQTAAQFRENDRLAARTPGGVQAVETLTHPDGSVRHSLVSKFAIPGTDREAGLVGGMAIDITDRLRAEEALREADRRKDEFLAMLAHELRNPLAPLLTALHVQKAVGVGGPVAEQARTVMERQVRHLARLVDDLLDVSRVMRGKVGLRRERVELAAAAARAAETVQPLLDARGPGLTVELPPQPVFVDADPVRLAQVLSNLLNNAAKYTDRGGHITLSGRADGGTVTVSVRDTGAGIHPDLLPRVFDLFVQGEQPAERAQGGLGVGLTLVKRLVELHGGTVEARSEGPGRGSEFVVRLPAADALAGAAGAPPGDPEPARVGRRVLVADDNRDAAESLAVMLGMLGHEVRTAGDGLEAVDLAERFGPEVALLDLGMPRVDGYEAARRIRARPWGRRVVLVALTGWGQEEDRRRSRAAGFDHHLVKPVDPDTLQRLLLQPR